jgi:hypothetical protein
MLLLVLLHCLVHAQISRHLTTQISRHLTTQRSGLISQLSIVRDSPSSWQLANGKSLSGVCAPVCCAVLQVPKIKGLRESAVVAARKGQKPRPATKKGFGS